jgi:hypothetical protein
MPLQAQARAHTYLYGFDGGLAPLRERIVTDGLVLETRFAPLFGGGIGHWGTGRLGGEFIFALAPSTARATGAAPFAAFADGRSTFTGSGFARLLIALSPLDLPVMLFAGAGPGVVAQWGGAYSGLSGKIKLGGSVSLGVRMRIARYIFARAETGDWIYKLAFDDVPGIGSPPSRWQHDLAFSLGAEVLVGEP